MKDSKYKVTNTTVKPPRLDPKTKKDLRTMVEKVGHVVTFADSTGRKHTLYQHKPAIVSEVNQGILNLQQGGFVKIERVDDISEILKSHTAKTHTAPVAPTGTPMPQLSFDSPLNGADTVDETPNYGEPMSNHGINRRAHAAEMGLTGHSSDTTETGSVNPDGAPNFAVTAKHNAKPRREK